MAQIITQDVTTRIQKRINPTKIDFQGKNTIAFSSGITQETLPLPKLTAKDIIYFTGLAQVKAPDIDVNKLIQKKVVRAVGCTEPGAMGLCASAAFNAAMGKIPSYIDSSRVVEKPVPSGKTIDNIKSIEVTLDPDMIKNTLYVKIPNTDSNYGIKLATVLGLFSNPDMELALFGTIKKDPKELVKLIDDNKLREKVTIKHSNEHGLYIKAKIEFDDNTTSEALIKNEHSNIESLKLNGRDLIKPNPASQETSSNVSDFRKGSFKAIMKNVISQIESGLQPETKKLIWDGIEMNKKVAEVGLKEKHGDGIGYFHSQNGDMESIEGAIYTMVAASTDARMAGVNMPVMSSNGSGNQGLIITNAIAALAEKTFDKSISDFNDKEKDQLIKSVAVAHAVTAYTTEFVGVLSPLCGCATKAGLGSTAGMAYYLYDKEGDFTNKGSKEQVVENAMKNMIGANCGTLCDGAKGCCAKKTMNASFEAYNSALEANNKIVGSGGIPGFEDTSIEKVMTEFIEPLVKDLGRKVDEKIVTYLISLKSC